MSPARLSLAAALVVALASTPRGVSFVGVGSAPRTCREASASASSAPAPRRRHAALARARATERRPSRQRAMQTDAEEEIRAASLANVRNELRCGAACWPLHGEVPAPRTRTRMYVQIEPAAEQAKTCTHHTPLSGHTACRLSDFCVPSITLSVG